MLRLRATNPRPLLPSLLLLIAGCITPSPILSGDASPDSQAQSSSSPPVESKLADAEIKATVRPTLGALYEHLQSWITDDELRVTCSGETWSEGHLATPYERWYEKVKIKAMARPDLERIKLQIVSTRDALNSVQDIELAPDHFSYRYDAISYPLRADECDDFRIFSYVIYPFARVADILRNSTLPEIWWRPSSVGDGAEQLSRIDESGHRVDIHLGVSMLPERLRFSTHDAMRGAISHDIEYRWKTSNQFHVSYLKGGRRYAQLNCVRTTEPFATFTPSTELNTIPTPPASPGPIDIVPFKDDIFIAEYSQQNHRSLLVVQSEEIWVFEAPVDASTAMALIAEVHQRWPQLPITRVFITHHHPDHAGGLRAYIAQKIPIVTTPGNVDFFRSIAYADFDAKPDTQSLAHQDPEFLPVVSEKEFVGSKFSVRAIDIGPETHHTQEHLVFYFPQHKLLFQGDLISMPQNVPSNWSPSKRMQNRFAAIRATNYDIDWIIGAWPLRETRRSIATKDLEERIRHATQAR